MKKWPQPDKNHNQLFQAELKKIKKTTGDLKKMAQIRNRSS